MLPKMCTLQFELAVEKAFARFGRPSDRHQLVGAMIGIERAK